jgi:hypothetical protein
VEQISAAAPLSNGIPAGSVACFSDGRFGAESQDEFVGLGFDDLLGDVEVRQRRDAAEQRDVILSQLEHSAVLNAPRQQDVAHQRPRLNGHFLLVILSIQWTKSALGTFLSNKLSFQVKRFLKIIKSPSSGTCSDLSEMIKQDKSSPTDGT